MPSEETEAPRGAEHWARPIDRLHVQDVPAGAKNLVEGKQLVGPIQGFGRMWQKTYRIRLEAAVQPGEIVREWKDHFAELWPPGNQFYAPLTGLAPGEVALIKASVAGGLKLSTGVLVLYSDDEAFTLMTPQGHMFAGWITFSSFEDAGSVVAQIQVLIRAQDPLSELGLALGGHRQENRFWEQTLRNLAAHLGTTGPVETQVVCVDRRRQWSKAGNIRHSAAIRNGVHSLRLHRS